MRHYALLVRRGRWTNARHSSSFVVCVGIFVHAQNCARSSTHECTRPKDARGAQSALDQRQTHAGHTRSTRGAHAGHALCVRRLRPSAHLAHRQRTPSVLLTHVQRAQRSSSVFLACAWRAHRVWPWVISSLPTPSSFLLRHSWVMTYIPADRVSKNYLRRWMIPTCCEYNTKSRFSNINRTSWNWHFTKPMSSGEGESEEVMGGSGSDHGSVGDDSLAYMTSYLWNSEMKTRHISRTSCGCPPRCSTSY